MAGFRDGDAPAVAISNPPYSPMFGFRPRPITSNPWTSPKLPVAGGEAEKPSETKMVEQDDDDDRWDGGDDDNEVVGSYSASPQAIGMGRQSYTQGQYQRGDGGAADKRAAAQAMGYQTGQTAPGEAIVKGLGLLSGIPGAGTLAGKASDKLEGVTPWFSLEEGTPKAGTVGTVDYATGDVWGTGTAGATRGYDPITGKATANYTSGKDAWNTWNHGYNAMRQGTDTLPGQNAIAAGLGSFENSIYNVTDAERQQGITPGSKAGALPAMAPAGHNEYISREGNRFTGGIQENAPGAGVTFSSGNLRTDSKGQVVEAAVPTIDPNTGVQTGETHFQSDDDHYQPDPAQVQAEKNVSLDAFGGSGDDSGGGGGGK